MNEYGTGWCPTCRSRRRITDIHHEGHYEARREVGYSVTEFECGHDSQSQPIDLGPAPGGDSLAEAINAQQAADRLARAAGWQS